jgi:hypothetical protein
MGAMFGGLLSNVAFLNPWVLAGLGALPILYFLLRVMPPAPRLVQFPATRFLIGLIPDHQTPSKTPWWLLLLRLIIAALVLLALAHPVHNPASQLSGAGAVRLVIDNGWASAQTWSQQIKHAEETLKQAGREGRDIYILTTAAQAGRDDPLQAGPMKEAQALSLLKGLEPLPWAARYSTVADFITKNKPAQAVQSFWFSHGLDEGGFDNLARVLQSQGGLRYHTPAPEHLPLLLRLPDNAAASTLGITVVAPVASPAGRPVTVQLSAENGRIIDRQQGVLDPQKPPLTMNFDIPEALRNDVASITITGQTGSGGTFILDERFRKRSVGIVGPSDVAGTKPFIEGIYYLRRALEPYATLHVGDIPTIISENPAMIILPDIGAMPAQTLVALEDWVRGGGLLLRFAGPNMAREHGQAFLTPVLLRSGGRSTQGSLSWEASPKLTKFEPSSPFYGITVRDDITVQQQILAEPSPELDEKTWARLNDGTPLITADTLDKGLVVMVHTTASAEWSDLALSGVYVEILQRLSSMAASSGGQRSTAGDGNLQPIWVLDGLGRITSPQSWVKDIPAADFDNTAPSSYSPPGLYGRGGFQQALNIGGALHSLYTPQSMPAGVTQQTYGTQYELDLMPYVLSAAFILFLCDWLIMLLLMSGLNIRSRGSARLTTLALAVMLSCFISVLPSPLLAAEKSSTPQYADGLYLAYIQTGNALVDETSRRGLENLARVLTQRTSAEPDGVAALNPERDTLSFFPLIYWPISAQQENLSDQALRNVQAYLDQGGTILFDTRDQNQSANALSGTTNTAQLRKVIGFLNIPPLEPVSDKHVIGRSFYLLQTFPGRYTGGELWVEQNSMPGRDGVSSVIIGAHDWAGAWALDRSDRTTLPGGVQQQEMAFRFGINLMMYALTGNYKSDQVHVPHILQRLGQ